MTKGYCVNCKKEMKIIVERTLYYRKQYEIKISGHCQKCQEPICRILADT